MVFHAVIEKDGLKRAVYSKADYEYMERRGWKPVPRVVAAVLKPAEPEVPAPAPEPAIEPSEPVRVKRKYTRRAK